MSVSANQSSPKAHKRHISREYEQNGGTQYSSRRLEVQIFGLDLLTTSKFDRYLAVTNQICLKSTFRSVKV